jgi:hypothetical protein
LLNKSCFYERKFPIGNAAGKHELLRYESHLYFDPLNLRFARAYARALEFINYPGDLEMYRPTTSELDEARRALEFGHFRLVDLAQSMKLWGPRSGLALW